MEQEQIIIYHTQDGKASVALYARDGKAWMSQAQLAELFATSKQNISVHIQNILEEKELEANSVVKDYLTTASDGKNYQVTFYSLEMILAIGFRVRSRRGTQFRQWANQNLKEFMVKGFVMVFLETAELRAKNRQGITTDFWRENIDKIIAFNDKPLLNHKGSVSHAQMKDKVNLVYEDFNAQRKRDEAKKADELDLSELKQLEQSLKNRNL